jgi:hypothetical protein
MCSLKIEKIIFFLLCSTMGHKPIASVPSATAPISELDKKWDCENSYHFTRAYGLQDNLYSSLAYGL